MVVEKTGGTLFLVGPDDDGDLFFSFHHLFAESEGMGVENIDVVVEFFVAGFPVFEPLGDGVFFIDELDFDWGPWDRARDD